jgi:uncharacterized protein DUF3826
MFARFTILISLSILFAGRTTLAVAKEDNQEEAYARSIAERSRKIVTPLDLQDQTKAEIIERIIAEQYRGLRNIHDSRDAKIESLSKDLPDDDEGIDRAVKQVQQLAQIEQFVLHRRFIARLTAELSPVQVTIVKDGMTYGVVPTTYSRYLQLLPNLQEAERKTVMALLIEAREYAMDGGSSKEKHGWFRKYKGKINNYLSSVGYDLNEAEKQANQ